MAKIRKQIREYVVQQITGQTTAGSRVYNGRMIRPEATDLPLINITTGPEPIDTTGPGYGKNHRVREVDLFVTIFAKAAPGDEVLNTIDDICEVIEGILNRDTKMGGLIHLSEFQGTDTPVLNNEVSVPFAFVTLEYKCKFVEQ